LQNIRRPKNNQVRHWLEPRPLASGFLFEPKNIMHRSISVLILILLFGCSGKGPAKEGKSMKGPAGMVWIPGGEFTMGTDDPESYEYERPAHRVRVDGFWMDATEVTNEQFKEFVEATHYITTAETPVDWELLKKQVEPGTPKPADSLLKAGSLIFSPPSYAITTEDYSQWWKWKTGANWQHPEGPGSSIEGRGKHPVVQVSYDDAVAYAKWAGKRLPTEAEWEFASRGGKENQRYSWGNEIRPQGKFMANTFQGVFPTRNDGEDGFPGSSPVKSFPANEYGLYDIIGNCWEWTSDYFNVYYYSELAKNKVSVNPMGAEKPYDPQEPYSIKHVTRGGSFLCATNYCVNFRPSARQGSAFDSGMSHIGFRCASSGSK
jgi:sulfatase modifying factor 1